MENLYKLENINAWPPHMQMDYVRKNENIIVGRRLCFECGGTGNAFYSMYKKCPQCHGTGIGWSRSFE